MLFVRLRFPRARTLLKRDTAFIDGVGCMPGGADHEDGQKQWEGAVGGQGPKPLNLWNLSPYMRYTFLLPSPPLTYSSYLGH